MKIAFLNFHSGFRNRGGETFVDELAKRLAKNNQIIVVQAGPKTKEENYKSVTVPGFTNPEKIGFIPRRNLLGRLFLDRQRLQELTFSLKSIPIIRNFQPDIIIPINGAWEALIFSIYVRLTGTKLVIAGQSGPGWDDRFNLLIKPHLFVALTNRQFKWSQKATLWKQPFSLIPNGVDLNQFKAAGKKVKLDLEKPIILCVAASTPDKRVEEGIRAVSKLEHGSLLLLGKGPLDESINKLGYKLLGKKRFFHTAVTHELMPDYYRAADMFTLCSESSEAFGIVYLEAMASGLPVIATDDESRHEIIGQAGVFVKDSRNITEYTDAIKSIQEKEWGSLPRHQAEKFSWDKIATNYEKAFGLL